MTRVGILAVQGAFVLHEQALQRCGVATQQVRTAGQLEFCDALVIPGGESTVISKLLVANDLVSALKEAVRAELPFMGTCAGMILLSSSVLDGTAEQISFSAIDLDVQRNAYGRQIDSFEASVDLRLPADIVKRVGARCSGLPNSRPPQAALPAIFIRSPAVRRVGAGVEVWASHKDQPVLCRQGSVVVASFHPELTAEDDRVHEAFLALL